MDQADINNRFIYHKPSPEKAEMHDAVRGECLSAASSLNSLLPDGREKSLAITHLEEVMFWANAAIARS